MSGIQNFFSSYVGIWWEGTIYRGGVSMMYRVWRQDEYDGTITEYDKASMDKAGMDKSSMTRRVR